MNRETQEIETFFKNLSKKAPKHTRAGALGGVNWTGMEQGVLPEAGSLAIPKKW